MLDLDKKKKTCIVHEFFMDFFGFDSIIYFQLCNEDDMQYFLFYIL